MPSEKMEAKRKALGFSDELVFQKFAYGFYADRFLNKETKDLTQYEWFVGSLSEECLRNLLSAFLSSEESFQLHPTTRVQLEHYLRVSEISKEEGYAIDLARSNNLGLLLLARTGMTAGALFQGFSNLESEIEKTVYQTLEKINALSIGQTHFFSAGTMTHETQFSVKRIDEDLWEIVECDSNSTVLSVYKSSSQAIMDREFWNQIYKKKFIPNIKLQDSKLFAAFEEAGDQETIRASSISPQKKNTCHLRCHLGLLKSFVTRGSELPIIEPLVEWRSFKLHFGNYILTHNKIKNQRLLSLAEKRQVKRKKAHADALFFQDCIKDHREEETLKAYAAVFDCFGLLSEDKQIVTFKDLLKLHQKLVAKLEQYPVTPEQWEIFFEGVENPWVAYALHSVKLRFEDAQLEWMEILDQEFAKLSSMRILYDQWQAPLETKVNSLLAVHLGIYRNVTIIDLSHTEKIPALHAHDLDKYLERLEANPQLLTPMKQRKNFCSLLIQALQMGEAKRVENLLGKLPKEEQEQFLEDQGSKLHESLCLQSIPRSLYTYVYKNPSTALSKKLIPVLGLKAIQERNFQFIYDFHNHPELRRIPNGLYRMQGSVEKNPLSEEEIKQMAAKLIEISEGFKSSVIYSGFIYSLAYSLIENRSFDLLEELIQKCDLPKSDRNLQVLIQNKISLLSKEETDQWITLVKKHPDHPLSTTLKYFLIFPAYHHGLLERIQPLDFVKNFAVSLNESSFKDFHALWDLDNFDKGVVLLQACESIPLLSRLLFVDLLALACQENDLEKVKEICLHWKLDTLTNLVQYEGIDEKTLLFLSRSMHTIGVRSSILHCITALLETKSFACYELANTIIEDLMSQDKNLLDSITIEQTNSPLLDQARVRYQKKCPKTLLSRILTQISLNTWFRRMTMSDRNYATYREQFIENWCDSLENDDAKVIYQMNIAPVFECNEQNLTMIIDIWEHLPPSKTLRDAFALLFLKNGFRDYAYWVYPDHEGLEALIQQNI